MMRSKDPFFVKPPPPPRDNSLAARRVRAFRAWTWFCIRYAFDSVMDFGRSVGEAFASLWRRRT